MFIPFHAQLSICNLCGIKGNSACKVSLAVNKSTWCCNWWPNTTCSWKWIAVENTSRESTIWIQCQKYQLGPSILKLNWSIWLEYCPDFFFFKQSFWNYNYQYTNACWRLVGSDIGSDVIREPLILTALKQETFSSRNSILENCRLQFNINQISTLNMISENNLIFLFFPPFFPASSLNDQNCIQPQAAPGMSPWLPAI